MSPGRRMLFRVVAAVFAAASVLPSGWVFCMEATGDVQVEYSTGLCCTIARSAANEAVAASSADACEGCQDISLECSAHRKERFESAAATSIAVCTSPLFCPAVRVEPRPFAIPTILADPTLSRLSSVVIRC